MIDLYYFRVMGAALLLGALVGCADHPIIETRSALDGKQEPALMASDAWSRPSRSRIHPAAVTSPTTTAQTTDKTAPATAATAAKTSEAQAAPNEKPSSGGESTSSIPTLRPESNEESVVVISTSYGNMVIALEERAAPKTSANFEKLTLQGFYNRTTFHRVIPGFMIQGGDPSTKNEDRSLYGTGGPGYTIPAEIGLPPVRGAVAMARLSDEVNPRKESSGSQFFICVADCPHLAGGYTVFGHVIKGMDVADKIAAANRDAKDCPIERIEMQAVFGPKSKALQ